MKQNLVALLSILLLALTACAGQAPPPAAGPKAGDQPAKPAAEGWQQQWDKLLAQARTEGSLVIVSAASSDARTEVSRAFKEKTGLSVEWVAGRPAELLEKLRKERQAGIYSTDAYWGSPAPVMTLWKPEGMLGPVPPLLLPEVTNPQAWYGGKLRYLDKDRTAFSSSSYPLQTMLVNTDMVSPGEIKSYRDLLAPKWKGKIVMNDPAVTGVGQDWFAANVQKITGPDIMRELAKQGPVLSRDLRLMTEWIAKGKYPILIAPQMTQVADFMRVSAPISLMIPSEGTVLFEAMGVISAFDKAPHPATAQVFVNWFLSKDGQTLNSKLNLTETARLDADTGFLPAYIKRQAGGKYFETEAEEYFRELPQSIKLANEIFGSIVK
ncbi:MAG: extracellular solute-binding protein [Chloroflexi bacterium]|nr:extracellular solute-binding protein [Chloroflexota bacterium]